MPKAILHFVPCWGCGPCWYRHSRKAPSIPKALRNCAASAIHAVLRACNDERQRVLARLGHEADIFPHARWRLIHIRSGAMMTAEGVFCIVESRARTCWLKLEFPCGCNAVKAIPHCRFRPRRRSWRQRESFQTAVIQKSAWKFWSPCENVFHTYSRRDFWKSVACGHAWYLIKGITRHAGPVWNRRSFLG